MIRRTLGAAVKTPNGLTYNLKITRHRDGAVRINAHWFRDGRMNDGYGSHQAGELGVTRVEP
jgi:hypothetical protein